MVTWNWVQKAYFFDIVSTYNGFKHVCWYNKYCILCISFLTPEPKKLSVTSFVFCCCKVKIQPEKHPGETTAINVNPKYLHCYLMMVRRNIAVIRIHSSGPRCGELVHINSSGLTGHLLRHICIARAIVRHSETHSLKWLLNWHHKYASINNY